MSIADVALLALALAWLGNAACYRPEVPADRLDDAAGLPLDLFADAAEDDTCAGADPSPLSSLRIQVRTSAFGGRFAPRNVGAIWIEDAQGSFVKTVERWGQTRMRWLTRFMAASGGDVTDAVTGATLTSHKVHDVTWNLTDLAGCEVGNGAYQVVMETTDRNGTGATAGFAFTKATVPTTVTPADAPSFHDLTLSLE